MRYIVLIVATMCLLVGCHAADANGCGAGTELEFEGASYCVYEASIIEEGFRCPNSHPNQYDFGDYRACGQKPEPPDDLEQEVYRVFRADAGSRDGGSQNDAGGCTGDPPECAMGVVGGCCGDGFELSTCINSAWQCPDFTVPVDSCTGFGPQCGTDSGIADGGSSDVGLWHLPNQVDPVVLGFFPNGRFRWEMNGCDSRAGDHGRWRDLEGGGVELIPGEGRSDFRWPGRDAVYTSLTAAADVQAPATQLSILVEESVVETWKAGGQCPICGNLGPTGVEYCDNPFLPESP